MNEEDIYRDLCLATNDYFAAKIAYTDIFGTDIYSYVVIYRKDTWESYESFSFFGLASGADQKEWCKKAENVVMQLDKPEDWKRPHRYCLARYAGQVLKDDFFRENLSYNNQINDKYVYRYTMISRSKQTALIKRLNLLSYEEKKQLFILKDWEKEAYTNEDVFYGVYSRRYLYEFLNDKEIFERDYKRYEAEFEQFRKEYELFR